MSVFLKDVLLMLSILYAYIIPDASGTMLNLNVSCNTFLSYILALYIDYISDKLAGE